MVWLIETMTVHILCFLFAVAYAAGIQFAEANPLGYTFGSPKLFKIGAGCNLIDSTRWFRFVNSKESQYRFVDS